MWDLDSSLHSACKSLKIRIFLYQESRTNSSRHSLEDTDAPYGTSAGTVGMMPITSTGRCVKGWSLPQNNHQEFCHCMLRKPGPIKASQTGELKCEIIPSISSLTQENNSLHLKKKTACGELFSFYDKMAQQSWTWKSPRVFSWLQSDLQTDQLANHPGQLQLGGCALHTAYSWLTTDPADRNSWSGSLMTWGMLWAGIFWCQTDPAVNTDLGRAESSLSPSHSCPVQIPSKGAGRGDFICKGARYALNMRGTHP